MDGGTFLALISLLVMAAIVALLGIALKSLALSRPWHIIEINEDGSLRRIQQLTNEEAALKRQIEELEQELRVERAGRRMDMLRAGGHPEVPAPGPEALNPTDFGEGELQTIGEVQP